MIKDEAWEMIDSALDHSYSEKDVMEIKEALDVPETNFGNIAAQKPTDIAALVEGMEVSIDVSTGEHDSNNRLFGTVTLAQENQGSKHGLILLVQEPTPNFKVLPVQEPVAWITQAGVLAKTDTKAQGELYGWTPLYTAPEPAQEPNNFCPRCGKRVQGVLGRPQMHTCTPPLWGHT